MIRGIIYLLKNVPSKNPLVARAKGYYQLPTNFKELKRFIKLRWEYGKL